MYSLHRNLTPLDSARRRCHRRRGRGTCDMRRYLPERLLFLTSLLFGASAVAGLHGQAPEPSSQKRPAFEVASIKQPRSFEPGGGMRFQPGGLFQGTNVYVLALIAAAFGEGRPLLPAQIDGGPDWVRSDRFEIIARTTTPGEDVANLYRQLPALLRSLLEDRFRLETHWETRQLPAYALVLAHKNGRLGPQLRRSHCTPRPETIPTNTTLLESPEGRPLCNVTFGRGMIQGSGLSILTLAGALSTSLQRVVLDRTELEGTYDVKLQWAPDSYGQPDIDPNIPPLSTALQEQLGLKLESTKNAVDVLVIDHVEKPAPD